MMRPSLPRWRWALCSPLEAVWAVADLLWLLMSRVTQQWWISEKSLLHSKTLRRGPALAGKLADKLSASLSASLSAWNQCGLESV